jgi:paraquat-inducible protein A
MILVVPALLVLSALCLAFGLVLPLVRFEKLYFFSETPSLIDIVLSLWGQGNGGLAVLVGLFSSRTARRVSSRGCCRCSGNGR